MGSFVVGREEESPSLIRPTCMAARYFSEVGRSLITVEAWLRGMRDPDPRTGSRALSGVGTARMDMLLRESKHRRKSGRDPDARHPLDCCFPSWNV